MEEVMPRYKVEILHHRCVEIEVKADSPEAAMKAAEKKFGKTIEGDRATSDFEATEVRPVTAAEGGVK
jgi:hypothetical protein